MYANAHSYPNLPHPQDDAVFYEGILRRRIIAGIIDVIIVTLISLLVVIFTLGIGFFFWPVIWYFSAFLFLFLSGRNGRGTWGMRGVGIETRTTRGERPDQVLHFIHSAATAFTWSTIFLVPVNMASIYFSPYKQGVIDHILSTTIIRSAAS